MLHLETYSGFDQSTSWNFPKIFRWLCKPSEPLFNIWKTFLLLLLELFWSRLLVATVCIQVTVDVSAVLFIVFARLCPFLSFVSVFNFMKDHLNGF